MKMSDYKKGEWQKYGMAFIGDLYIKINLFSTPTRLSMMVRTLNKMNMIN